MHHLDEVAGAGGADPSPPRVCAGSEGFEDGAEALDGLNVAADHHAVALFQAPDAARGADIDEVEALGCGFSVAADGILVVGVASVNEGVAGGEMRLQLGDGLVDGVALGNHDPDGARGFELGDHLFQAGCAHVARCGEFGDSVCAEVEAHYLMAAQPKPLRHVAAHLAETNQS